MWNKWQTLLLLLFLVPFNTTGQELGVSLDDSFDFIVTSNQVDYFGEVVNTDFIFYVDGEYYPVPSGTVITVSPIDFNLIEDCCSGSTITIEITMEDFTLEIINSIKPMRSQPSYFISMIWEVYGESYREFSDSDAQLDLFESDSEWGMKYHNSVTRYEDSEITDIESRDYYQVFDKSNGVLLHFSSKIVHERQQSSGNVRWFQEYSITQVGYDPKTGNEGLKIIGFQYWHFCVLLVMFVIRRKNNRRAS